MVRFGFWFLLIALAVSPAIGQTPEQLETMRVQEAMKTPEQRKAEREAWEAKQAAGTIDAGKQPLRAWSFKASVRGKTYKAMQARLVKIQPNQVSFVLKDGKPYTSNRAWLSPKDKDYLAKLEEKLKANQAGDK